MSTIDDYIGELSASLRVRGRARRRLLRECRDHLVDASAMHGEDEAVRRFGAASDLAVAFDIEIAARRGRRAVVATVAGVTAVGGSTLALLQVVDSQASAVPVWAVIFFASAQATVACVLLALVQSVATRRRSATPSEIALLCRRSGYALSFACLTLLSAGGAVPGRGSVVELLAGPAVALVAAVSVQRTRSLARQIGSSKEWIVRSPVADGAVIARIRIADPGSRRTLVASLLVAVPAAFLWDHGDYGSIGSSAAAAGIEAALIVFGFLALGPSLGLRDSRRRSPRSLAR